MVKVGPVPARGATQITPPFYAYSAHRGMKRILLDLKASEGVDALRRLAARADVLIESFRPGVMARLGAGPDDLRAINPRLVYCSTTGYGQTGPQANWAGHDLNYLAGAGFLDCSGRAQDGQPSIPGATVADSAGGGMHAVMSILAALVARATTGEGAYLDVSVADGVLALMALQIDEYLATGAVPGPRHGLLTGRYACYDTYQAADGKWVSLAAIEPRFWANVCRLLDLEQWVDHQTDDSAQDLVRADLAAVFATRPARRVGGPSGAGRFLRRSGPIRPRGGRGPAVRRSGGFRESGASDAGHLPAGRAHVGRNPPTMGAVRRSGAGRF